MRCALSMVIAVLGCGSAPAYGGEIAPTELKVVTDGPPFVEPAAMIRRRIAGEQRVMPDGDTIAAVRVSGATLTGIFKYCVDQSGAVSSVSVVQSTGVADYDARIERVLNAWVFKPIVFHGQIIAACSPAMFRFSAR